MSNKNDNCNFNNMLKQNLSLVMSESIKHMIPSNEISQKVIKTLEKELMELFKESLPFMESDIESITIDERRGVFNEPRKYAIIKGKDSCLEILLKEDKENYKEYVIIDYLLKSISYSTSSLEYKTLIRNMIDKCENQFIQDKFISIILKIFINCGDDTTIKDILVSSEKYKKESGDN